MKQLYVALGPACYPRITADPTWTDRVPISEVEALRHVTPAGLADIYAGHDVVFGDRDQGYRRLMAYFSTDHLED